MIWSTTTHVGMAVAVSTSDTTYVVARYSPPGTASGRRRLRMHTSNRASRLRRMTHARRLLGISTIGLNSSNGKVGRQATTISCGAAVALDHRHCISGLATWACNYRRRCVGPFHWAQVG